MLLDELVEEVEDLSLPFGQWLHAANIRKQKAKIKVAPVPSGTI